MLQRLTNSSLASSVRTRSNPLTRFLAPGFNTRTLTFRSLGLPSPEDIDFTAYMEEEQKSKKSKKNDQRSARKRGLPSDSPEIRLSKTLSWVLRHGSQSEGLRMRPDGYVRVDDLLNLPKFLGTTFKDLDRMVCKDAKNRYHLLYQPDSDVSDPTTNIWWIRANQGHSMKTVQLDLQLLNSAEDIPARIAVHGTNLKAWESIRTQGLRKMNRNHIHLAQGVPGSGVISGMRNSAQILVYIDVQKAMDAGIKFFMSANGVVLTEGDSKGYLRPEFFARVVTKENEPILDWNQPATQTSSSAINQETGESPDGESTTAIINSATDPIEDVQQKTDALVL